MNRNYDTGIADNVEFFVGIEIEKTPAFGQRTLFVLGLQSYTTIKQHLANEQCTHIFFGANHSYNPITDDEFTAWDNMIKPLLKEGILCSLDIPSTINLEWVLDGGLCESNKFIPQIRVVLPYVKQWNYNTMIKIDDKGFDATNPGVWCHSLHSLMNQNAFTDWAQYQNDRILK